MSARSKVIGAAIAVCAFVWTAPPAFAGLCNGLSGDDFLECQYRLFKMSDDGLRAAKLRIEGEVPTVRSIAASLQSISSSVNVMAAANASRHFDELCKTWKDSVRPALQSDVTDRISSSISRQSLAAYLFGSEQTDFSFADICMSNCNGTHFFDVENWSDASKAGTFAKCITAVQVKMTYLVGYLTRLVTRVKAIEKELASRGSSSGGATASNASGGSISDSH
jgi:hypothetical protein